MPYAQGPIGQVGIPAASTGIPWLDAMLVVLKMLRLDPMGGLMPGMVKPGFSRGVYTRTPDEFVMQDLMKNLINSGGKVPEVTNSSTRSFMPYDALISISGDKNRWGALTDQARHFLERSSPKTPGEKEGLVNMIEKYVQTSSTQ